MEKRSRNTLIIIIIIIIITIIIRKVEDAKCSTEVMGASINLNSSCCRAWC